MKKSIFSQKACKSRSKSARDEYCRQNTIEKRVNLCKTCNPVDVIHTTSWKLNCKQYRIFKFELVEVTTEKRSKICEKRSAHCCPKSIKDEIYSRHLTHHSDRPCVLEHWFFFSSLLLLLLLAIIGQKDSASYKHSRTHTHTFFTFLEDNVLRIVKIATKKKF